MTIHYKHEKSDKSQSWSCLIYTISDLLLNVALLSAYTVLLAKDHPPCLTKRGTNITRKFVIVILFGALLVLLRLLITNVYLLILRRKAAYVSKYKAKAPRRVSVLAYLVEWMEVCLGVLTVLVSLLQYLTVNSKIGQYCVYTSGIL